RQVYLPRPLNQPFVLFYPGLGPAMQMSDMKEHHLLVKLFYSSEALFVISSDFVSLQDRRPLDISCE
ncbi:hypothetical protein L9F63_002224, partial [Diploptera punctata]